MSPQKSDCDATLVIGGIVVFALPLTLLIPGFSVWNVIPKIRVVRCLIFTQDLTWPQLNTAVLILLLLFFCLYLEIRKRKMDELVDKVLASSKATDKTLEMEKERQTAAMHVCVDLLDTSTEHYEHLVLLRDELRQRNKQRPPAIEPSNSMML